MSSRPDLGRIITALHASEINGEMSWFFDGAWRVTLGDSANGIDAAAVINSPEEAAEWLRANAIRLYPERPRETLPRSDVKIASRLITDPLSRYFPRLGDHRFPILPIALNLALSS
jgi:hypothetical protein